jgi:hypothetical protein
MEEYGYLRKYFNEYTDSKIIKNKLGRYQKSEEKAYKPGY